MAPVSKRDTPRRARRRAVAVALEAGLAPARREPTDAELLELAQAAASRRSAAFGLVRLSALRLDGVAQLEGRPGTLIEHAARAGADEVVAMLLRAGADASCSAAAGGRSTAAAAASAVLDAAPWPQLRAWLIKRVVEMRDAARDERGSCAACGRGAAATGVPLLRHPRCTHVECEACVWGSLDGEYGVFRCAKCPPTALEPDQLLDAAGGSGTEVARASLARWEALPERLDLSGPRQKKGRFQALPPEEAAGVLVGTTRGARTDYLLDAAANARPHRAAAVIRAGVDIDATDEYGRTAVFLAAARGGRSGCDTLRVLLRAGADPHRPANGAVTPHAAARIAGIAEAAALLEAAGAAPGDLDPPDPAAPEGSPNTTELVPTDSAHPGRGACFVDGAFSEEYLSRLDTLAASLDAAGSCRSGNFTDAERLYYCDASGWVRRGIAAALRRAGHDCLDALPQVRFLRYATPGGQLAPHVDLAKKDAAGRMSTHSFLLYLTGCPDGGETVLLDRVTRPTDPEAEVLATVQPTRGRLLLFPHVCPHAGRPVLSVPKLLVRGECY